MARRARHAAPRTSPRALSACFPLAAPVPAVPASARMHRARAAPAAWYTAAAASATWAPGPRRSRGSPGPPPGARLPRRRSPSPPEPRAPVAPRRGLAREFTRPPAARGRPPPARRLPPAARPPSPRRAREQTRGSGAGLRWRSAGPFRPSRRGFYPRAPDVFRSWRANTSRGKLTADRLGLIINP